MVVVSQRDDARILFCQPGGRERCGGPHGNRQLRDAERSAESRNAPLSASGFIGSLTSGRIGYITPLPNAFGRHTTGQYQY